MFTLDSNWFDFHLSSLKRAMVTLPCLPVYTDSKFVMVASTIETVQIRFMTTFVPPGPFEFCGTAGIGIIIVVLIFGGERNTMMIAKGVASSSCKVKVKNINIYKTSI